MKMLPVKADSTEARVLSNNLYNHFPMESLKWIAGVIDEGGTLADGVANHIVTTEFMEGVVGEIEAAQAEKEIRNNAFFFPFLGVDDYAEVNGLVWCLKLTATFKNVNDFTTLTDDERERCVATMIAAHELKGRYPAAINYPSHPVYVPTLMRQGGHGAVLNDPLFSFVLNNPGEVREIVETAVEHGTMDPVELRGLMSGITRPLAGGAL